MKKLLCIAFAFFLAISTQALEVSKDAYISIITCAPGTQEYARFGHSAIRYCDSKNNTDVVFNYGLFSYSDDFAYNFAKGETYYRLGVQQFRSFITEYLFDNRSVIEQKLDLTQEEIQQIFQILRTNYRPENREYLYNFFIDNCSTRPRDVLQKVLGNNLQWEKVDNTLDSTWLKPLIQKISTNEFSWRDLIHIYVGDESWLKFGIDLGLGVPADSTISLQNAMFLPDGLCCMLQSASIMRNSKSEPLVTQTHYLYKANPVIQETSGTTPGLILWILCVLFIFISIVEYKYKKHMFWLDSLLYLLFGIVGIFVWYVSFVSIHPAVFPNSNVVWANPLHILFAVIWLFPKIRNYTKWYIYIYSIFIILYLIVGVFQLQYVHAGFIALIFIIVSRIWNIFITKN